ncbi:MAG TPA: nuclear transport factor 2 family protein [Polyangia bacterium]|nr:nuclear transport factor 2 family protein [Polyangia bacterium]
MRKPAAALIPLLSLACARCAQTAPPSEPEVRKAVERLLGDQAAAVERGDLDAWAAPLDRDVFLFGSDPTEATFGRDAILAQLKKNAASRMRADVHRTYRSTARVIGVAADRRAAWVADEIDYTLAAPDGEKKLHFRMTALLGYREAEWRILAAHYSVPVPHEQAFRDAGAHALKLPTDVGTGVAAGAQPLVDLFRHGIADPAASVKWISDRPDVVIFGTAPGERHDGATIKKTLAGARMAAKLMVTGGIRAGLSPSGGAGWVAGNAVVSIGALEIPMRTLELYALEGGAWRLVCAHSSIGVPD